MRTYRPGATMGPLLAWNALVAAAGVAVLVTASEQRSRRDAEALFAVAGVLALVGPIAFAAYFLRWLFVRVGIGASGLVLSDKREVGWGEIEDVEVRGWRPGPWNPFTRIEMGCFGWFFVIVLFKVVLLGLFVMMLLWLAWTVVVPVLVLYSPWHSRVVIRLADGSRLVYRDLSFAEEFAWELGRRLDRARPAE